MERWLSDSFLYSGIHCAFFLHTSASSFLSLGTRCMEFDDLWDIRLFSINEPQNQSWWPLWHNTSSHSYTKGEFSNVLYDIQIFINEYLAEALILSQIWCQCETHHRDVDSSVSLHIVIWAWIILRYCVSVLGGLVTIQSNLAIEELGSCNVGTLLPDRLSSNSLSVYKV